MPVITHAGLIATQTAVALVRVYCMNFKSMAALLKECFTN